MQSQIGLESILRLSRLIRMAQRGLHNEVHKVFSTPWQAKIRASERQQKVD